jgi:hypothetical protein
MNVHNEHNKNDAFKLTFLIDVTSPIVLFFFLFFSHRIYPSICLDDWTHSIFLNFIVLYLFSFFLLSLIFYPSLNDFFHWKVTSRPMVKSIFFSLFFLLLIFLALSLCLSLLDQWYKKRGSSSKMYHFQHQHLLDFSLTVSFSLDLFDYRTLWLYLGGVYSWSSLNKNILYAYTKINS